MNLQILNNDPSLITRTGQICRIGKSGSINFSHFLVDKFSLKAGDRYLIAFDKSEKIVSKVYLIPTDKKYGTKLFQTKEHLRLNAKILVSGISISFPVNCDLSNVGGTNGLISGTLCLSFLK